MIFRKKTSFVNIVRNIPSGVVHSCPDIRSHTHPQHTHTPTHTLFNKKIIFNGRILNYLQEDVSPTFENKRILIKICYIKYDIFGWLPRCMPVNDCFKITRLSWTLVNWRKCCSTLSGQCKTYSGQKHKNKLFSCKQNNVNTNSKFYSVCVSFFFSSFFYWNKSMQRGARSLCRQNRTTRHMYCTRHWRLFYMGVLLGTPLHSATCSTNIYETISPALFMNVNVVP